MPKPSRMCFLLWIVLVGPATAQNITVFSKDNGAPKHFQSSDGRATGYAVELTAEALRRAGYAPEFKAQPWKRAQINAMSGAGLITGFSRTPEREKTFFFTEPLYLDQVVLVFNKNAPFEFNEPRDLASKKIGIGRGSNYAGEFATYRNLLSLEEDDGHRQRLLKLSSGRLDAAIFPGGIYLVKYNARRVDIDPDIFIASERLIAADPNHIGIPRTLEGIDPAALLEALNTAIAQMKKDGTSDMILQAYEDPE